MNTFRLVVFAISFVAVGTTALSTSNEFFPKPISSELPMYPETARMARVAGTVKLWFVLNGEGEVTQTNAVSGNPLLRGAAANTVNSWKFLPNTIRPSIRYETEFVYMLEVQPEEGQPKLRPCYHMPPLAVSDNASLLPLIEQVEQACGARAVGGQCRQWLLFSDELKRGNRIPLLLPYCR